MSPITLSYVVTTFNKIEYLKITLAQLMEACQSDEEIVVVDGGSDDGTQDYLAVLWESRKIHQFISEKDFGEAHGINKAMMMAKGKLVKIITDDDVYYFPAVQRCKAFMLEHQSIDVLGFDGLGVSRSVEKPNFAITHYIDGFRNWTKTKKPFLFCGLSLMIRKTSLAYLGLFNTKFKIVDLEYSMRVSSLRTKIAFYTGLGFVNIVGPDSNSVKFYGTIEDERVIVRKMYLPEESEVTLAQRVKNARGVLGGIKNAILGSPPASRPAEYEKIVEQGMALLEEYDRSRPAEILIA